MDVFCMEKKRVIVYIVFFTFVLFWLLVFGQLNGASGLRGDVNLIDEGQFGAWINHMLNGKKMYKDFFPPYGPLQVFPIYVLTKIFGPTYFIIRFYVTVLGVFLGLVASFITLKILKISNKIGWIVLFFFILYPGIHIRSWIVVLALALLVKYFNKNSVRSLFLIGVLSGYTLLQSVESGIFLFLISFGYVLVKVFKNNNRQINIKNATYYYGGFLILLTAFSLFSAWEGWLFNYIQSTISFLTSVSGINLPNGQGLPNILGDFTRVDSIFTLIKFIFSKNLLFYWTIVLLVLSQTVVFIRYILHRNTSEDTIVFLIIIYVWMSYFGTIGRSGHHFFYASFIVLFAGYFLSLLFRTRKKQLVAGKLKIVLIILLLAYISRYLMIYRYTSYFDFSGVNYVNRVGAITISKEQAKDIRLMQEYINRTTRKKDTIFLFNNMPGWYFLLDRENATKYDFPLLALLKRDRLELVAMLEKNNPVYIIEDLNAWPVDEVSDRQRMPEVLNYMNKNYFVYAKKEHFLIYKKR